MKITPKYLNIKTYMKEPELNFSFEFVGKPNICQAIPKC